MNKLSSFLLMVVIAVVVSYGTIRFVDRGNPSASQTAAKESTYDRIMRTRTVRCSYLIWPPYMNRDVTTGKLSGVYYDLLERMGKDWAVKIDWVEEVGAANRFEGFKTGRYDLLCSPTGGTAERTAVSDFSIPFVYESFYLYARAGDTRFDNAYEKLNDEHVTLMTQDGYMGATISKSEFPKAKLSSLPELSSNIEILTNVEMGKADAAVCDASMGYDFMRNNQGKIKRVSGHPLRVAGETIPLPIGEDRLRSKINSTLTYYLDSGVIEKILTANGLTTNKILYVAKPYAE